MVSNQTQKKLKQLSRYNHQKIAPIYGDFWVSVANQMGKFTSNLAEKTKPMIELLSTKNQNGTNRYRKPSKKDHSLRSRRSWVQLQLQHWHSTVHITKPPALPMLRRMVWKQFLRNVKPTVVGDYSRVCFTSYDRDRAQVCPSGKRLGVGCHTGMREVCWLYYREEIQVKNRS